MHQPWRTFAAVINRCISRKTTGLEKLRLSRAQILLGIYHYKNVDFVKLLWEDFAFQIDNYFSKESMPYPRFTKIIINHFISQNKSISMRNRINLQTARDDSLLGTLKYVSKTEGVPDEYTTQGNLVQIDMELGTITRGSIVETEDDVGNVDHDCDSTINESIENVSLAKSSSQLQSTYEAATSLTEDLYDALVKSYQLDKDLFESYAKKYSLKRGCEYKDKDEDPSSGSEQGLKKRKTSKDDEPPKGSKSNESMSSSSKGTKSQLKSSGKFVQAEEPMFESVDTKMPQDQGGNTEDQPNVEENPMKPKRPKRPLTPIPDWNAKKSINSRPPQNWISIIAKAEKPPLTFDELMSTPIDFSAYFMHNLKIDNLTQEILVGPAFNLLKGTCKSFIELEYHFGECYKAATDQLDWNNPEGHGYPFNLSKTLPLIEA
ncbi:hypothetical protein Tco_1247862 [Tanacetum coccineum]